MNMINLFFALFFVTMFMFFANANHAEPEAIIANLSNMESVTFNITTNTLPYTSFYHNEPSLKGVILNLGHAITYGLIVEANTMIPLIVNFSAGNYALLAVKLLILYVILKLLFVFPNILKAIISIYFFVKEKKYYKEKWYH